MGNTNQRQNAHDVNVLHEKMKQYAVGLTYLIILGLLYASTLYEIGNQLYGIREQADFINTNKPQEFEAYINNVSSMIQKKHLVGLLNAETMIDSLRTTVCGVGESGILLSRTHEALKQDIADIQKNPEKVDRMTEAEKIAFIEGVVMRDGSRWNMTAKPGDLNYYFSIEGVKAILAVKKEMLSEYTKNTKFIEIILPYLKNTTQDTIQQNYLNDALNSGMMSKLSSYSITYNFFYMVKTILNYLSISSYVNIQEINTEKRFFPAKLIWITRIFTGYGITIIPFMFFTTLVFHFFYISNIIACMFKYAMDLTHDLKLTDGRNKTSLSDFTFLFIRYFIIELPKSMKKFVGVFICTNVFFVLLSYVITAHCNETMIGKYMYSSALNRKNIISMMIIELCPENLNWYGLLTSEPMIVIATLFWDQISSDCFKKLISYLYGFMFNRAAPHGIGHWYDGFITASSFRFNTYHLLRTILKSNELYSILWKMLLRSLESPILSHLSAIIPYDSNVNEVNTMVPWVSTIWNPKFLHSDEISNAPVVLENVLIFIITLITIVSAWALIPRR